MLTTKQADVISKSYIKEGVTLDTNSIIIVPLYQYSDFRCVVYVLFFITEAR